jgi:hypothetical protein
MGVAIASTALRTSVVAHRRLKRKFETHVFVKMLQHFTELPSSNFCPVKNLVCRPFPIEEWRDPIEER